MRPNDVAQALDLDRIAKDHVWKVEPSCATSGEGKLRIHQTIKSPLFKIRILTFFHKASSKVSPGSARTSRSRRSKEKRKQNSTSLLFSPPSITAISKQTTSGAKKNKRTGWHPAQTDRNQILPFAPPRPPKFCSSQFTTSHDRLQTHLETGYFPESGAGAAGEWEDLPWSEDKGTEEDKRTRKTVDNETA